MSPAKSRGRQGARAARASARDQGRLWWIGGGVLVVGLGIALIVLSSLEGREPETEPAGVETVEVAGAEHVNTPVEYPETPPVGGNHNPVWQNCGYYSEPIASEFAVHSLEHGAVWITYQQDLPEDQVDDLRSRAARSYVLVSPWEGELPAPVVASAWGKQMQFESAGDPQLSEFVEYFAQGPQTPEPGAACTGGAGTPE
ncbi:MAG TPA: DUF3105 domain-containing protein [Acidimicrobiales bacterium]|jgi:hypothetical protein|nr:DUF3105 domain-containing protein [Acidimicrobiales bacterium]